MNVLQDFDTLDGAMLVRQVVKAIRAEGHGRDTVMHLQYGFRLDPHIIINMPGAANRVMHGRRPQLPAGKK